MSARLKALYELQAIDLQLAKAQKSRAALDNGSSKKQQIETARTKSEKADRLLHEATTELRDKELNLKTVETKQKTFRDKLYGGSVTNPKELSSMEKEIEMLDRQKGKLEERILELMDIIEERKTALADMQATLKREEDEYAVFMDEQRKKNALLVRQMKELLPQRELAAAQVDPVLIKRYEALRARQSGIVVSKMHEGDCTACHMKVSTNIMRDIKAGDESQTCDNCGRMLFLEE